MKEIFNKEIKDKLYPLDKKRKSILFKNYLLAFGLFLILWHISLVIPGLNEFSGTIFIGGLIISIFVNFTIHNLSPAQEFYHKEVKEILVPTFLKLYHNKFEYKPEQYIAPLRFINSGFSKEKFHKSKGSDLVLFKYKEYKAQFSFFTTFKRGKVRSMRIPNSGRAIEITYRGFLLIIDIPENMYKERFDIIKKMKEKKWEFNEDANSVYFSKESDICFFKTSIFNSNQSYIHFAESIKILGEAVISEQLSVISYQ